MNFLIGLIFVVTTYINLNNAVAPDYIEPPEQIEIIEEPEIEIKDERSVIECKEGDILFEQDGVVIQVKEYNSKSVPYSNICFWVENFSGKDLTFCSDALSVDGYMSNSALYENVMNDCSATVYIALNDAALRQNGITNPAYFEIAFSIYDESGPAIYKTDIFKVKTKFYKEDNNKQNMQSNSNDSQAIVYDANEVKIVANKNITKDEFNDLCFPFYIENNSDVTVRVYPIGYVWINGIETDILFEEDVLPGRKANSMLMCWPGEINDLNPEDIKTMSIQFGIKHIDTGATIDMTDLIEIQYK